uniref:2'-phosphotransferase n=1 Tax=Alexandrium monilatum TaxID=311494 RepID=A0A7S4PSX8_9DINO
MASVQRSPAAAAVASKAEAGAGAGGGRRSRSRSTPMRSALWLEEPVRSVGAAGGDTQAAGRPRPSGSQSVSRQPRSRRCREESPEQQAVKRRKKSRSTRRDQAALQPRRRIESKNVPKHSAHGPRTPTTDPGSRTAEGPPRSVGHGGVHLQATPETAGTPGPPQFPEGSAVRVHGLKHKEENNGREGVVLGFVTGKQRFRVKLTGGTCHNFKPDNLEEIRKQAVEPAPSTTAEPADGAAKPQPAASAQPDPVGVAHEAGPLPRGRAENGSLADTSSQSPERRASGPPTSGGALREVDQAAWTLPAPAPRPLPPMGSLPPAPGQPTPGLGCAARLEGRNSGAPLPAGRGPPPAAPALPPSLGAPAAPPPPDPPPAAAAPTAWPPSRPASAPPGGRSGPASGRGGGRSCPPGKGRGRGCGMQRDFRISKAMTTILRHTAASLGLCIRPDGFCFVSELLQVGDFRTLDCTAEDIRDAVRNSDKKRFDLLDEGGELLVRATQGHSMKVVSDDSLLRRLSASDRDLPRVCVHGTYKRHLQSILQKGLLAGGGMSNRNHVHFAPFEPGDGRVISGMRTSCEVAIYVDLRRALGDGVPFFLSSNQVVLSPGLRGVVPSSYIKGVKDVWSGRWIAGGA